jgi:hypothetical protein
MSWHRKLPIKAFFANSMVAVSGSVLLMGILADSDLYVLNPNLDYLSLSLLGPSLRDVNEEIFS